MENTEARYRAQQLGYTSSAGPLPNLSVTSSIPSDPMALRRPPTPVAQTPDPGAAYTAWNGIDGDNPVGTGAFLHLGLSEAAPESRGTLFGVWVNCTCGTCSQR